MQLWDLQHNLSAQQRVADEGGLPRLFLIDNSQANIDE